MKLNLSTFILLSALIPYSTFSKVTILKRSKRYPHLQKRRTSKKAQSSPSILNELYLQNKRINELLLKKRDRSHFVDSTFKFNILTGSTYIGTLLNSITSDTLSSPVLVEFSDPSPFVKKTRLNCKASQKASYLSVSCKTLILEGSEYPVDIQILELDGQERLDGITYSNLEESMLSDVAATLVKSVIKPASHDSTISSSLKKSAQNLLQNSPQSQQPSQQTKEVTIIKSNKPILIHFKRRFSL